MKLIIDIPEEKYKLICSDGRPFLPSYKWIKNGTPIPDNATNGDVIKAMFKPNRVERTDDDIIVENYDFSEEWWNAPYEKGGK